jgi:V8-like Glu-specific endopeptidase
MKTHDHQPQHQHDHGHEHEHERWDFPPTHTPHNGELSESLVQNPSDEHAYQTYYESMCGSRDDSLPVEQYDGRFAVGPEFVATHQRPVGQLRWNRDVGDFPGAYLDLESRAGQPECSGTLVDVDLFLTAGHCFVLHDGPRPADVARSMHVAFDYQVDSDGDLRETRSYDVVELVEHAFHYQGVDYALLRLDGSPGARFGTARLAPADAAMGDALCLISHPNGLPKRVETGHVTHIHDVRIGYGDLDTARGSSGAGLLDERGRVVGIHTQAGCDPIRGSHNHGIRVGALLSVSSTLQALASASAADDSTWSKASQHVHTDVSQHSPLEHTSRASPSLESFLESHRSSLESHRSTFEAHGDTLESHRSSLESHEDALREHRQSLDAVRDALDALADELRGGDSSPTQTSEESDAVAE